MSRALVTGSTGFIDLSVVNLLLERGHHVNIVVRSLKSPKKCKPLLDLQAEYPDKLAPFAADLMKSGSFRQAMEGGQVVWLTYRLAIPDPKAIQERSEGCVEPALQRTIKILESVNETDGVSLLDIANFARPTHKQRKLLHSRILPKLLV